MQNAECKIQNVKGHALVGTRFIASAHLRGCIAIVLMLLLVGCDALTVDPASPLPSPPMAAADCYQPPDAITLAENWLFQTDPENTGLEQGWQTVDFRADDWLDLAPGTAWEFSAVDEYDGVAWYRTTVDLPAWESLYLGFGGVDDVATLYINGVERGSWDAGLGIEAALVDLSDLAGQAVTLAFRIDDHGLYGGLKQVVRLGQTPRAVMEDRQYAFTLADQYVGLPTWANIQFFAWTMTGGLNQYEETLLSSDGSLAPWADAPPVEILVYDLKARGQVYTARLAGVTFKLMEDSLPIPEWQWQAGDVQITGVVFHDLVDGAVRWRLTATNTGTAASDFIIKLVAHPFNFQQRITPVTAAGTQGHARLWLNGHPYLIARTEPTASGTGTFENIALNNASDQPVACDPAGLSAGMLSYTQSLATGQAVDLEFAMPAAPDADIFPQVDVNFEERLHRTAAIWREQVNQVTLDLPDDRVEKGFAASVGYLLLANDPDGPHPGPLAHDAVWTRDAAYIGLALLQAGHADLVRDYIGLILQGQEENGRVPPIQGENIPWQDEEWDAQGQAIFLVTSYYRYTGDFETLRAWYPAIAKSAQFIINLRAQTAANDAATRGLLPPSLSAEDLGPADQHYYWDNFWAITGLEEAAFVAEELQFPADATRFQQEADDLRAAVLASIETVMGADPAYIPGAVENIEDSAMARGTVPALFPYEVFPRDLPLLQRAFEEYHRRWIAPSEGGFRHRNGQFWTYGGLELAHAYLRLGRYDVLHQILGWTLSNQTLPNTYAWAEQVDPISRGFTGGDMPHAWAAASYATLIREMVLSEQGESLRLFQGLPDWWLSEGRTVRLLNAPTHFGVVDLETTSTVVQQEQNWQGVLTLTLSGATPPGGFRWQLPVLPDQIDAPAGTQIEDGWLIMPAGGTITLTFLSE